MEAFQRFGSGDPASYDRRFEQIIGNSPALETVLEQVERVAPTDSTVLIQGETGTGKELIAHAIHNLSSRCGRPFRGQTGTPSSSVHCTRSQSG